MAISEKILMWQNYQPKVVINYGKYMDWEALVQRLWSVVGSHGYEAFENKLRVLLPDIELDALINGLRILYQARESNVASALLCAFLKSHSSSLDIKRRLRLFVLFNSSAGLGGNNLDEAVYVELQALVGAGSIELAISLLIRAIGEGGEAVFFELLGHLCLLQQQKIDGDNSIGLDVGCLGSAPKEGGLTAQDDSAVDSGDSLFVWGGQEDSELTHDEECVQSAARLQSAITLNTPRKIEGIEWSVDTDRGTSVLQSEEGAVSLASAIENICGETSANDVLEARRIYFGRRYSALQAQEKEMLGFIHLYPASSLEAIVSKFQLTAPVVSYMLSTKLRFWLECNELGCLSIKQGLLEFLPENAFGKGGVVLFSDAIDKNDDLSFEDGVSSEVLVAKIDLLPESAKKVLEYFLENPGQKTHVAAKALGMSHLIMLSFLNGCLDDYLERDRAFVVVPRSGVFDDHEEGSPEVVWIGM